jgi:hypothetical protein
MMRDGHLQMVADSYHRGSPVVNVIVRQAYGKSAAEESLRSIWSRQPEDDRLQSLSG